MNRTINERLAVVENEVGAIKLLQMNMANDLTAIRTHIIEERTRRNMVRNILGGIVGFFGVGAAFVKILGFFSHTR